MSRYSAKQFVHHAKQLQGIQRTRNSVPEETYNAVVSSAEGSKEVARFFGMSEADAGTGRLRDRVVAHLESLGIAPTNWNQDKTQ